MDMRVRYERTSRVVPVLGGLLVYMALAARHASQSQPAVAPVDGPHFRGTLARPGELRALLLGLRDVVGARFHRPDLWRHIDPVVTSGMERVRLECFSSCASVYGRVDLTPEAFSDADLRRFGTTNVDFTQAFADAVGRITPTMTTAFELSADAVTLSTAGEDAVERKVRLPERWVRGFLQVQAVQSGMVGEAELDVMSARALIAALPARPLGPGTLVLGRRPKFVSSATPVPGGIVMDGAHRLRLLAPVLSQARALRVYRSRETGATTWQVSLEGGYFTLALSSRVARGFSGDGESLRRVSGIDLPEEELARAVTAAGTLNSFSAAQLGSRLALPLDRAKAIIETLSTHGMLGYEQETSTYFHRVLPFARAALSEPRRESGAKRLIDAASVEIVDVVPHGGGWSASAWVRGDNASYRVEIAVDEDGYLHAARCTCPWVQSHGLERGPCKHQLATRIVVERTRVAP